MSEAMDWNRLCEIANKIDFILEICDSKGGIIQALEDFKVSRPAILMHFTTMAEQFSKIHSLHLREVFAEEIAGAISVRNFIAHDYEGVNLSIIEQTIREILPELKKKIGRSKGGFS